MHDFVQRAQALAIALEHHYLGVEHLILAALTRDEAAAAHALTQAGLPPGDFIARLRDEIVHYPRLPKRDTLPLTPRLNPLLDLELDALFARLANDPHSLLARLAHAFRADPAALAASLAQGKASPDAPPPDQTQLMNTLSIAMQGQRRLDALVTELRDKDYVLQLDPAVTGWLLVCELESLERGESGALDPIFHDDIHPRLDAAIREHPPGSIFSLTLGGDGIDLIVIKGKPED